MNSTAPHAPRTARNYGLAFHGSAGSSRRLPRFRKRHETLTDARAEAARVDALRSGSARNAEPAVIHGPDGKVHVA